MDSRRVSGLIQVVSGAVAVCLQCWYAWHGMSIDVGHSAVATGVVANGLHHVIRSK